MNFARLIHKKCFMNINEVVFVQFLLQKIIINKGVLF